MQKSLKIGIAPALDKIGNLLGNFLELDRNWNWNFMKLAPLVATEATEMLNSFKAFFSFKRSLCNIAYLIFLEVFPLINEYF